MFQANTKDFTVYNEGPFVKRIVYQDDNVVVFTLNFAPGQALPPHTHFTSTVVVSVYEGHGECIVDDKTVEVSKGDIVVVKGDENFALRNTALGNLSVFVNMAPRPENANYSKDVG